MNIVILSENYIKAAQLQKDKHVCKLLVESAQILCNCHNQELVPYKRTHYNHPCCIWARESEGNYNWLLHHAYALSDEYTFRYGKIHKCKNVLDNLPKFICSKKERTEFVQCMPEQYKVDGNAVQAYRNYYIREKLENASWKNREVPIIFKEHIKEKII